MRIINSLHQVSLIGLIIINHNLALLLGDIKIGPYIRGKITRDLDKTLKGKEFLYRNNVKLNLYKVKQNKQSNKELFIRYLCLTPENPWGHL